MWTCSSLCQILLSSCFLNIKMESGIKATSVPVMAHQYVEICLLSEAFALMKKYICGLKLLHQLIVPLLGTSIYKVHTSHVILTYLPSIQL